MKAVIMAGGRGIRLQPLTVTVPKPLAQILGKPVLDRILDLLKSAGVSSAKVTLGYKPEQIEDHLKQFDNGVKIDCVTETIPLGTAGSVKNAAGDYTDDFIVISGDCFCDYDLTKAVDFHKKSSADLTIVTAKTQDPREYGLVLSDSEGKITGFSEKPDWSTVSSDRANTGIYIVSPKVLNLIPKDKLFDFSKDLFPEMMAENMNLYEFKADGYWCDIGDLAAYRACQEDILSGKTKLTFPTVCEGVYLKSTMPKGNYNIIPPVFIGENVEIADFAEIGPNTVVCDGCYIGGGAKVSHSVMNSCSAVFAGAEVFEAVLCENAVAEENSEIGSNSALGFSAAVGRNSRVINGASVWPEISVPNGGVVSENLIHSKSNSVFLDDNGIEGLLGGGLTPAKCCEIGQALASCKAGKRAGIATDGSTAAEACSRAVTGGLMSSGSHAFDFGSGFLSELQFFTSFCTLGIGIYISEKHGNLRIRLCGEGGLSLSRETERDFEQKLKSTQFDKCDTAKMHNVSDMSSVGLMYRRELLKQSGDMLNGLNAKIICNNNEIAMLMDDALFTLGCSAGDELTFKINSDGTSLSVFHRDCGWVAKDKLLAICCYYELQSGHDIAVPYDAPHILNNMAAEYERRVMRYLRTPPDNSDSEARTLAAKQIFARDGLFMTIKLLGIIKATGYTLTQLLSLLPQFYVKRKSINIGFSPVRIREVLGDRDLSQSREGILYKKPLGRVLIVPSKSGKRVNIFAEGLNFEAAKDLCGEIEEKISKYN